MRTLVFVLVGLASLSACSDPVADAERELAMIERSGGSKDEICAAKRRIADLHLKAQDEEKYNSSKVEANLACNAARLEAMRP